MVDIKLLVVGGDTERKEFSLELPTTIGRSREASITLPHPLVSRKHCEIIWDRDSVVVVDLNSLNGTFVGRDRISKATLGHGDLLTVGTVTFRAVYRGVMSDQQTQVLDDTAVVGRPLPSQEPSTVAHLETISESSPQGV